MCVLKKTLVQKKVDWEDFMDNVYELCQVRLGCSNIELTSVTPTSCFQISFGAGLDGGVLCDPLMQPGSLPTLRALQVKEDVKTYHKRGAPAVASEMACPLLKCVYRSPYAFHCCHDTFTAEPCEMSF